MQPTYYNRYKLRGGNYESITCYGANIMLGSVKTTWFTKFPADLSSRK